MSEPAPTAYPHLFSPITLGATRLKNRVVHASTSTKYNAGGMVTDKFIAYHVNRGRGGAAMTVTEPLAMLRRQENGAKIHVRDPANAAWLRKWAASVEGEDCRLIGQIQDPGRGRHEEGRSQAPIGASALPDDLSWTVPHPLSTEEVRGVITEFVESAVILRDAGWSGVEISSGHGHLFHQFLSAWSNRRTDRYGGDLEGRARLLTELITGLREAVGPDFLIGVKLPAEDGVPGGIDLEQSARITELVHATGAASYLTYCWGSHADTLDWHLPDLHGQRTPFVAKIKQLGQSAPGLPLGALGLITDPNEGERIVRDGDADLVMLARPLVTDPAWAIKAESGREAEIRYCVSCNTCWGVIVAHGQIQCDNNPRVGQPDEADWKPAKAAVRKRVVVVGSGVAGMEAAWVSAARGHDVIVLGASDEPGGKTKLHSLLPGGENLSSIYDYQILSAGRHGARLQMGRAADLETILALEPDVVVLATGATPTWPTFLPEEYRGEGLFPDIREAVQMLVDVGQKQPGQAVIYDHDHTAFTYATAEFLLPRFEGVTIITPRERLASAEALVNRQGIYRRLSKKGVGMVLLSEPLATSAFEEGVVSYANVFTGAEAHIEDVSLFTFATSRAPNDALYEPLKAAGIDVRTIGDAYAPRYILNATSEGNRVGNEI